MKILHLADLHMRDQDIDEIRKCLEFIIESATAERPDLAIIAGDVFDSRAVRLDSLSAKTAFGFVSRLANIAPVAVLIGTPSHDGMAAEVFAHVNADHPVYVSSIPEQVFMVDGRFEHGPGASPCAILSMVPTPTKQFFQTDSGIADSNEQIGQAMGALFAGFGAAAQAFGNPPHILVGHFQVGGAFVSETQQLTGVDIEVTRQQIEMAGADVVCMGHIHLPQQIGNNIFYSGSIYTKDFGEIYAHGFYYHSIEEHQPVESRFIETPTRKLVKITADITTGTFDREPKEDVTGAFVRLEIKTWQDEAAKIDRAELERAYLAAGAAAIDIRIVRVPRETVRSTAILKLTSLRDKIVELAGVRGETATASILAKCDFLESVPSEDIIKSVGLPY